MSQLIKVLSQDPKRKALHILLVYPIGRLQDVKHITLGHVHLQVLLAKYVQPQVCELKVVRGREEVQSVLGRHDNVVMVDVAEQGHACHAWRGCVADLEHDTAFFGHEGSEKGLEVGASGG